MHAFLTIEKGEGAQRVYPLPPDRSVTLGRSRDNDILLYDEHASRQHAVLVPDKGRWLLRDLDSFNGTRLDGQPLRGEAVLKDGQQIVIGDVRLRFHQPRPKPPTASALPGALPDAVVEDPSTLSGLSHAELWADELTALHEFMAAAVEEADPRAVARRALAAVHKHTGATVVGLVSLDPERPLPKLVLPELAAVDLA